jgi:hypothetical protein
VNFWRTSARPSEERPTFWRRRRGEESKEGRRGTVRIRLWMSSLALLAGISLSRMFP